MSQDKQTVNVLVLELATMVVAISLAFTATFVNTFDIDSIASYIFTNVVVIWFWWGYVVDRLAYPPKTMRFPVLDILILILISLVPFALKLGKSYYLFGVVGVLIIAWALMIRSIIRENEDSLSGDTRRKLGGEVRQRLIIGPLFLVAAGVSSISRLIGVDTFVILVVIVIAWGGLGRRRRASKAATLSHS